MSTMPFVNPFQSPGAWLRGNTHTHTTGSDGRLTPAQIGCTYRGYDFVFLTDHWKRTPPPSGRPARPLLIPAQELDFVIRGELFHVVCLGLKRAWPRQTCRSLAELGRRARRAGALLILAHPYWSGASSAAWLRDNPFDGVEVWNTVCDRLNGKGCARVYWDEMLQAGWPVSGLAADDTHRDCDAGRGWIMVKARDRSPAAILRAIRRGCFYSSQGPVIRDIAIRGRRLAVRCSPVQRINFIAVGHRGATVQSAAGALTRAEWEAGPDAAYARIECVDRQGRTAWSNPVLWHHPAARRSRRR